MDRRKSIKALAASVMVPGFLLEGKNGNRKKTRSQNVPDSFESSWHEWPDMNWAGPGYWGNRLQDWRISNGKLECLVFGKNRTLHSLVNQITERTESFETRVQVQLLLKKGKSPVGYAGFRVGAKATERYDDYRCAAVFGEGLDAGVTAAGGLFIDGHKSDRKIAVTEPILLVLEASPVDGKYRLKLSAFHLSTKQVLDELILNGVSVDRLTGNIALVRHDGNEERRSLGVSPSGHALENDAQTDEEISAVFSDWKIGGGKISANPTRTFGPVFFAQYTLHKKVLKLTAQLAPVEEVPGHKVVLQVMRNDRWHTIAEGAIDPEGRSVNFRIENWAETTAISYRVKLDLPLRTGTKEFFFDGTIAAEPLRKEELKVAVFSCNADSGFPDTEITVHLETHNPDVAVFLGDQFYESTGGFHIQTSPPAKARLDYLRKWYMFGWSYRDIFRHIPCAIIPDDHDVYHGNVWGEGGNHAPSDLGWDYRAQDLGGFKMPADWVNMVQRTQASHLPDAYDPTPVKQNIGVYYTAWNYGGISFAILEDRKFKSAPKNVLPLEAKINNGFIQNPEFDIKAHRHIEAELLGERQMKFLNEWASDWNDGVEMKAVLSQTNFCTIATLPKGSISDSIVPKLPIQDRGEYVSGDAPTSDMDSNGWPQEGRDDALRAIRKSFAFHIAGDQHLASMVHYGVDDFGDSGYAFAGPALNNYFPRRWWPPVENHQPIPGAPAYTGNFFDGFGNRMTVHSVANPYKTGLKPSVVYDRASGYGIVTFNKVKRTIHTECWPRQVDPRNNPTGQYEGWPKTITQAENYGRKAVAWLPEIKVNDVENAVVEIINERTGEVVYKVRIRGNTFKPKVFESGTYAIKVSEPDRLLVKEVRKVRSKLVNKKSIQFDLLSS